MSVELRPLNVLCNIQCKYCYQDPQRKAGQISRSYDLQKMKDAILAEGGPFMLFGGEPLLIPLKDLEDLWSWGVQQFGGNSVQTNGTLITDSHIHLFHEYRVRVGISVDGPGSLNDIRWHGTLENTRRSTEKTQVAIKRLCEEGIPPSLIITLHSGNASADKLDQLAAWVLDLHALGVTEIRLHLLESESQEIRQRYALTTEENILALRCFMLLERNTPTLRFDVFREMRQLLLANDRKTTCVWYGCDPYTTHAVRGVEGQGQRSNCGRTNKDGVDFVKSNKPGYERYIALYHTPQEAGGCQGCRFFLMCKGQCPGTAIDGDWRNRTEHCEVWKTLYEDLERDLLSSGNTPFSLSELLPAVEAEAVQKWSAGSRVDMHKLVGDSWQVAEQ
jgi:uncharacterized protein